MNELKAKVAEIAQGAARIMDANGDGNITVADAKYKAAEIAGKTREFVDEYDDMFEQPYNKSMRSIKISKWPGYAWWGKAFDWPIGILTWVVLLFLLIWLFVPRSYSPVTYTESVRSDISSIRGSLARLEETLVPKVYGMDARFQEIAPIIEELLEFTKRVEKTKMFRRGVPAKSWKKSVWEK